MQINLESNNQNSIQAYSETAIQINNVIYSKNLIVSNEEIITEWPIKLITELSDETIAPLLKYHPKIIIIGHNQTGTFAKSSVLQQLAKQQIALETMSIGAACRTFNVLLSEDRDVVFGVLF